MVLILIYLLLTAVAAFLAYQTISEVLEKLKNPVMSVTYQEVDSFPRPGLYGQHNLARLWEVSLALAAQLREEIGGVLLAPAGSIVVVFRLRRNRSVSRQRSAVGMQSLLPQ